MPIMWSAAADGRFVLFSVTDPYTIDEWRDASIAILSAPIRPAPLLVDRRHSAPLTTHAVEDMVRFLSEHQGQVAGRRVAILVSDDANFGMGRMTELRASVAVPETAIRTFRDYETAVDWLIESRE